MSSERSEKDIQAMANFEFGKEAPPLPIKIDYERLNSLDWTDARLHNGTFSSGFEFDKDRIIKLSIAGYLQNIRSKSNPEFSLQDTKFLVERTGSKIVPPAEALKYSEEQIAGLMSSETVDDFNRLRVEFSLERLAKEKLETYNKLKQYLGGNIPDFYGSVIVRSPRRKIEQKKG